ncbi:MAG: hypothetical protein ACK4HW_11025 [Roseinatronobacter sp.]
MLDLSFGPFLYGGLSLLAGGVFGYWLIRSQRPKAFAMLVIGHVLAGAWLYLTASAATGMASALRMLALALLVAPSFLGFVLGGIIGRRRASGAKPN